MELNETILVICTLITIVSSVMWEVNDGPSKIMRALHLVIGLILSVVCVGSLTKGMGIPFVTYPALIASGLVSIMLVMSKGGSFFAILLRLAHFVNIVCVISYFFL